MKKRAFLAKLSRPIMGPVFERERLCRVLERTRTNPLVWVSGPAGSGKTTLVASHIEAEKLPCLWYQLDAGDGDPATFFYHLGLAARTAAPRVRSPMPLLTPEYYQGLATFALRYFENLFARLKSPFVLVFDNFQEVPPDSLLHTLLTEGLSCVPEGIRVFVISRMGPSPEFSRFLVSRRMGFVGWHELRFTRNESRRVLRLWGRGRLPAKTVARMYELTQGWVAGLVLLAQQAGVEGEPPHFLVDEPPEEIFHYFAKEVFARIDEGTRDFLMQTAFLPSFTSEMADRLTGSHHSRRLLAKLMRNNHFTEKRHQPGLNYQYHPLFRTFLRGCAEEWFPHDRLQAIQRRAARVLEEAGQLEEAVALYRRVGEWDGLVRIILARAPELVVQGRNQTLLLWLKSLPDDLLSAPPWLLYWMGVALLPFDPVQAREWCEKAFRLFKVAGNPAGVFLCWSAIVDSVFLFERDRSGPLDRWIIELEELLQEFPQMPSPEVEARVVMSMFATLAWCRPSQACGSDWERKNLVLLEKCPDPDQKVMVGNWLALFYLYKGEMAKFAVVLELLRSIPRRATVAPFTQIVLSLLESYLQQIKGNREACLRAIAEGKETARTSGVHLLDFFLFASGVNLSLAYGELASARVNLESLAAVLNRQSANDVAHYHYLAAFEAFCLRDFSLARQHAETAVTKAVESGTEHHIAFCRIAYAQGLFELGETDQAERHLAQAIALNQRMGSHLLEYMHLMVQASFSIRRGLFEVSRQHLARAFALGREKAVMSPHWQVPFVLAELCGHALDAGIEVEYVQDLIRKFRLSSQYAPVACEKWPWPVKIYCLGGFAVMRDDKLLEFPVKAQKKPLEMLKVLVSAGERGMSEEQVSDTLWPDTDGDRAHQTFATTLHRLRKLLGVEDAIRLRDGRLTPDPQHCWVDAWAFERFAAEADGALKRGEKTLGLQFCEKAINLYHGPFLAGDSGWLCTLSCANRLQSKFLRCVDAIGKHLKEAKEWEAAAEHYRKGLEADPFGELLYQGLMRCLGAMDRKAEMLVVYERCKMMLGEHLGIDPSPATHGLWKSLNSKRQC